MIDVVMQPTIFDTVEMNLSKMQKFVLLCIEKHPEAATDDAALEAAGMELKGLGGYDYFYRLLKKAHRTETLTRRRRELIQSGQVTVPESVTERREQAFRNEQDLHRGKHWTDSWD